MTDKPTNEDVRGAWDANAAHWDARLSQPDSWQQTLIFPAVERLLDVQSGESILEIGCGNGVLAERMAARGAVVVATDFSEQQLRLARERATSQAVELRQLDATDSEELIGLGTVQFDAAVASMALMDMSDLEPLAWALPQLLKPGGRVVFAVTHPAFNNVSHELVTEHKIEGNDFVSRHSVKVWAYTHPSVIQGVGIPGQPELQWCFDRSLTDLLEPFLRHGLLLEALDEPVFDSGIAERFDERPVWLEIPPILAARLRAVK